MKKKPIDDQFRYFIFSAYQLQHFGCFFFVNNDKKILLYDQISIPVFSKDDLIFLAFEFDLLFNEITVQYRHFKNLSIRKLLTITSVDYQLDKF